MHLGARRRASGVGEFDVVAEIYEGEGGDVGSLVLPDGRRVLARPRAPRRSDATPTATVVSSPTRTRSRRHAEVRPTGDGFLLVDLGSMNGTLVNGVAVRERLLHDGDEISLGATVMRFEAS